MLVGGTSTRRTLISSEVIQEMQARGMDPPRPPFVLAPGEVTLYHEWGHHVDRTWSRSDQEAAEIYSDLRRLHGAIGTMDLRVAATALSVGGTLVTRNARDFEAVAGLLLEDWSAG